MALPVTAAYVRQFAALDRELFNMPTEADVDAFVTEAILDADAWMQKHMGGSYNLADTPSARIQARAQAMIALEYITDRLKAERAWGTHYSYVSEEGSRIQALIDLNWGERAIDELSLWVTVVVGAARTFAKPRFLTSINDYPVNDSNIDPVTVQYSAELDFARGISVPDVGTVRR